MRVFGSACGPRRRGEAARAPAGALLWSVVLACADVAGASFERNLGQTDPEVAFIARAGAARVFLTSTEIVIEVPDGAERRVHRMTLLGTRSEVAIDGIEPLPGVSRYYRGADPQCWIEGVPRYRSVRYREVYPGIDWIVRLGPGLLEHDFVLAPGADVRAIRLDPGEPVEVDANGTMVRCAGGVSLVEHPPEVYQETPAGRRTVRAARRVTASGIVTFEVGPHDPNLPLVIDPVLTFSTYLGGSDADGARGVAVDAAGNVVVVGSTQSLDFPGTGGGAAGMHDVVVARLDPSGTSLLDATYLGGSDEDGAADVAIDAAGNVFVTGSTRSPDFPLVGALQAALAGPEDAFVAKIGPGGLVASTYLGGDEGDGATAVDVDADGDAYVAGGTDSDAFPGPAGPVPCTEPYGCGFATKLAGDLSAIRYTTLLGDAVDVAVDVQERAYVSGSAWPGYFACVEFLDPSGQPSSGWCPAGGGENAQAGGVAVDSAGGVYLGWSTFLSHNNPIYEFGVSRCCSGTPWDLRLGSYIGVAPDVASHPSGGVVVTGNAQLEPIGNAIQPDAGGVFAPPFIARLDAGGAVTWATYLGGTGADGVCDAVGGTGGGVVVVGHAVSEDFPTVRPLQATLAGPPDAMVARIDESCGLMIDPADLPDARRGVPYAGVLRGSGTPPHVFQLVSGAFPPDLTLDPSGAIPGVPDTVGRYGFTIEVEDAQGCKASRVTWLRVCGHLAIEPLTLPPARVGQAYLQQLVARHAEGYTRLTLVGGVLPAGIDLRGERLEGTPVVSGVFPISIVLEDGLGCTATQDYELLVNQAWCAPVSIVPTSLPPAFIGQSYAATLAGSGGTPPYAFAVTAGALPAGLSLDASGAISGNLTAPGGASFAVRATDAGGCLGATVYTLAAGESYVVGPGWNFANPDRLRVVGPTGLAGALDIHAFGTGSYGTNVGTGDVDGGGLDEILAGPGPGPVHGPLVRAFRRNATPIAKVHFYAYGTLKHGVLVTGGNIDADAYAEIVTGAGPGSVFGPHVRGFDFDGSVLSPVAGVSFFAFATPRYGVNVAAGDVDGDGYGELLAAAGPAIAFAPIVRGFDHDGSGLRAITKLHFWAFGAPMEHGADVGAGDLDGDEFAEIVAGRGPGPSQAADVAAFDFDGSALSPLPGAAIRPFATSHGARVAAGDVDADADDDLVAACGPSPAAERHVVSLSYDGGSLVPTASSGFVPFATLGYGVDVAAGLLGD